MAATHTTVFYGAPRYDLCDSALFSATATLVIEWDSMNVDSLYSGIRSRDVSLGIEEREVDISISEFVHSALVKVEGTGITNWMYAVVHCQGS